jgi:hypothetical protein
VHTCLASVRPSRSRPNAAYLPRPRQGPAAAPFTARRIERTTGAGFFKRAPRDPSPSRAIAAADRPAHRAYRSQPDIGDASRNPGTRRWLRAINVAAFQSSEIKPRTGHLWSLPRLCICNWSIPPSALCAPVSATSASPTDARTPGSAARLSSGRTLASKRWGPRRAAWRRLCRRPGAFVEDGCRGRLTSVQPPWRSGRSLGATSRSLGLGSGAMSRVGRRRAGRG